MRLGGPVYDHNNDPETYIRKARESGYGAVVVPAFASDETAGKDLVACAQKANVLLAEVGAWSNPLSAHEEERQKALQKCRAQLALADRVGARCCVNISGSKGERWDGPHPDNLTQPTFDRIVETVRGIIDEVKPTRTHFTLETMPWMYPDSADSYLALLKAIDRPGFAAHLDPVNLICSPQRYFKNTELIRDCFEKLGPHIKSCHAKDILLGEKLTVHLDECAPGEGVLDYAVFLKEVEALDPDMPVMLEHIPREAYPAAADFVCSVAAQEGIEVR